MIRHGSSGSSNNRRADAGRRLSNTELAERIGLSPSPCLRRVRNLEREGVITGYHAAVDPAAIGRGFQVLLHVDMSQQDRKTIEAFEAQVNRIDVVKSSAGATPHVP